MNFFVRSCLLILSAAFAFNACKKDDTIVTAVPAAIECAFIDSTFSGPTANDGRRFSLQRFEASIKSQLDGNVIGYQWALSAGGFQRRANAAGLSRIVAEGGEVMRPCQRMNIASVTKTLTAVAVLKLLGLKGLTIDSPMAPWLPPSWTRGPGINNITFGQLLTHQSGLMSANNTFDTLRYTPLRNMIARGTGPNQGYLNANFALCRILIANLQKAVPDDVTEEEAAHSYQAYVNKYVLNPAGIADAGFSTLPGSLPTNVYRTTTGLTTTGAGGYNPDGDGWYYRSGGGGWMLSAIELNRFQATLRYSESILSTTEQGILFSNRLGLADSPDFGGVFGQAYGGNGGIVYGSGQGYTSVIYFFPYGIEATLLLNSLRDPGGVGMPPTYPFAPTVLKNAYLAAWE